MGILKSNIRNTNLSFILVNRKILGTIDCPILGSGTEGTVYGYTSNIAIKIFDFKGIERRLNVSRKFEKIEKLGTLLDDRACFPLGLVGFNNYKKEGIFLERPELDPNFPNFQVLSVRIDLKRKIIYAIKASDAIKRFHEMGLIIGDIKGDNILIDINGEIKFIDTDNWKFEGFGYDVKTTRGEWLKMAYDKPCTDLDNDRFLLGTMALALFIPGANVSMWHGLDYYHALINYMNVPREIREGLRSVISDSTDKPYIGDILKEIDFAEEVISDSAIHKMSRGIY